MVDAYYSKRQRRVQKTITYATGATDQIVVVGPCSELTIGVRGVTDAFTPDMDAVGLRRIISRLVISSNLRGQIGDLSGISLGAIQRSFFGPPCFENADPTDALATRLTASIVGNSASIHQTTGGSAGGFDGWEVTFPFGIESGEICTFTYTMGTLVEMAVATNLAGYTGIIRMTVSLDHPKTFWAYRRQDLGAAGVIGVAGVSYQSMAPLVPSFAMVGGVITALITDKTAAANVEHPLASLLVTISDDYLIDDQAHMIRRTMGRRIYGNIHTAYLPYRHTPCANDASYQVAITNGATATIHPSEIVYLYQSGVIAKTGMGITPAAGAPAGTTGGGVTLPQPTRVLSANQPAPPLGQSGAVKSIFGPR
jgi:hypothetical protein